VSLSAERSDVAVGGLAAGAFGLLVSFGRCGGGFLQRADFTEPLHRVRFVEAFVSVGLDLQQAPIQRSSVVLGW
jgi:hypothetical protein